MATSPRPPNARSGLGDIDQLGRDLQESVPRLERWMFSPLPCSAWLDSLDRTLRRKDDESPIRHAVRVTLGIIAVIAGAEAILLPVLAAIKVRPQANWTTTSIWAVGSLALVAAGGILFPLICDAMIRALGWERRSRLGVALYAALSGLVVIALGAGFAGFVSLDPRHGAVFARSDWLRLLAMALFSPPTMIATAHTTYGVGRGRSCMGNPRSAASNHFFLSTTWRMTHPMNAFRCIAFLAAFLLLPASGPAFGAPRVRDTWHAFVADGQRYGSVHTVVARLPDGNYRISAESRLRLDVLGLQKEELTERGEYIVTADYRPVSIAGEGKRASGATKVAARRRGAALEVTATVAGVERARTFERADRHLAADGLPRRLAGGPAAGLCLGRGHGPR